MRNLGEKLQHKDKENQVLVENITERRQTENGQESSQMPKLILKQLSHHKHQNVASIKRS